MAFIKLHNDSLTQYTLICNTNNPKIGGEMAENFSYPLQITRSILLDYASKEEPEQENGTATE